MQVLFEIMVQIKHKRGIEFENPSPRCFSGGFLRAFLANILYTNISPSFRKDAPYLCCSVLQCVAACCSVLQCVAVCCSVLQCVAV